MSTTVLIQVNDSIVLKDRTSLAELCDLRTWCYDHIKNGWCSYYLNTTDDNKINGIGWVAFDFEDPKESLKFQLTTGGI